MTKEKVIVSAVTVVIAIILIFSIIAGISTTLRQGAESVTEANNCSLSLDGAGTSHWYNITDGFCWNSTGADGTGVPEFDGGKSLPLASMFSSGGVLILILMGSFLLLLIGIALKGAKKH